jgi:hypothetical protein
MSKGVKLKLEYPFEDGNKFNNLPPNLEHLCLITDWNKYDFPINFENRLYNLNNLPKKLKVLEITPNTYVPIETLPEGLETLIISCKPKLHYIEQTNINLPKNLNMLILNYITDTSFYKNIIENLFNNNLTCKYLLLRNQHSRQYAESIEYIKTNFPNIKLIGMT